MPTPEQIEVAELLLRRAAADEGAARVLAEAAEPDDGVIGFHAQQAAGRALSWGRAATSSAAGSASGTP